jgi:hypothetical protein
MTDCSVYTISEGVEKYMNDRMITKKKFFPAYLNIAKDTWQTIFRNTLWVIQTRWLTLKAGDPYSYIDMPRGVSRLLGVQVKDHCNLLQPLYYNAQLDIVPQPAEKKCGCPCPDCAGLCEDVNSFSVSTQLLFSIAGVPYYEKTWLKYCPNGDILEYKEIPTKKYNTIVGDGGDFNADFNDDYFIGSSPFGDYTVVTVKQQRKICHLETLACGCPAETPENCQILNDTCGCNLNWSCRGRRRHCRQYSENINPNHWGEIKLSECMTKIFYRPSRHWRHCTGKEFPDFLQVSYQGTGIEVDAETTFPDFCIDAMTTGIDWRSKRFNGRYSQADIKAAEYRHEDAKAKVIAFLNPINLIELAQVQDAPIKY